MSEKSLFNTVLTPETLPPEFKETEFDSSQSALDRVKALSQIRSEANRIPRLDPGGSYAPIERVFEKAILLDISSDERDIFLKVVAQKSRLGMAVIREVWRCIHKALRPPKLNLDAVRWFNSRLDHAKTTEAVFTKTEQMTVERCEVLLAHNDKNRPPSEDYKIPEYARDMMALKWDHNGETMKVTTEGLLNDGQNRCLALLIAAQNLSDPTITFTSEVTWGVTRESRDTVDIGLKRTIGQNLVMNGRLLGREYATTINVLLPYLRADRILINTHDERFHPTGAETRAFADENDDALKISILCARRLAKFFRGNLGVYAAIHFRLAQIDRKQADEFFEALRSGTAGGSTLLENDPAHKLRNDLIENIKRQKARRFNSVQTGAMLINAWNALRNGKTMRTALYDARLPFPTPV